MIFRILGPILFLLCSAAPAHAEVLKKAAFLPQWFPQAQFAGYYVAQDKGIYRRHGIDLTMLRGGPEASCPDLLAQRRTDFATMFLTTAVQRRAAGIPLVNIAQVVQRSGFILVARKSRISSIRDLKDKKVSLWPDFQLQPIAFFRKNNLAVKAIPQAYTLNLFLREGVDAASAMWYNEYHTLLNSGLDESELTAFFFDRYGLNFPEDGIYCLQETWKKDPDLCRRFAQASLKGWEYAFAHPEEALDIVMKYVSAAKINMNRIHQKWMLEKIKALITQKGESPLGALKEKDYQIVAGELQGNRIIAAVPDFGSFHVPAYR